MRIYVQYPSKEITYFEIEPENFILDLKLKIQEKLGIPFQCQKLKFNEEKLEYFFHFSDYEIKDEDILLLEYKPDKKRGINIIILTLTNNIYVFNVNHSDTIEKVKNIIYDSIEIPPDQQRLIYKGKQLEDDRIIDDYHIINGGKLHLVLRLRGGGCIDDLIKQENGKNFWFDLNLLKRDELYVNLIYFDFNMTNQENYLYYNLFKRDVVGGFYAIDDLNILRKYLEQIKNKNIPFIIISSGSSGKDVISISKDYTFIKEVIIFCSNLKKNEHYIKEYPNYVKKVLNNLESVYSYLKTFFPLFKSKNNNYENKDDKYLFSFDEIKMEKQLKQCPVISSFEYDFLYFLIHKAYSDFFGNINEKNINHFKSFALCEIKYCLSKINFSSFNKEKRELISQFRKLFSCQSYESFVEKSIKQYTKESNFCYLFNRIMRNFEKELIDFSYYIGPLLYSFNRYVKYNPDFAFSKSMKLYRIIECSELDFYLYKLNLGHIICFPSLTSTSSAPINFKPSNLAKKNNNNEMEKIQIKMIFNYIHEYGNISPGIIIEDKKNKEGKYLSCHPNEKEVILFPFTFAKITNIQSEIGENKIIEFEIINRKSYIEYTLRDDPEKRFKYSKLK